MDAPDPKPPIVIDRRFDSGQDESGLPVRSAGYRYRVVAPGRTSPEVRYLEQAREVARTWAEPGQRIAFGWKRGGGGPLDPDSAGDIECGEAAPEAN